jgi:hypothetical protein
MHNPDRLTSEVGCKPTRTLPSSFPHIIEPPEPDPSAKVADGRTICGKFSNAVLHNIGNTSLVAVKACATVELLSSERLFVVIAFSISRISLSIWLQKNASSKQALEILFRNCVFREPLLESYAGDPHKSRTHLHPC